MKPIFGPKDFLNALLTIQHPNRQGNEVVSTIKVWFDVIMFIFLKNSSLIGLPIATKTLTNLVRLNHPTNVLEEAIYKSPYFIFANGNR